MAKVSKSAPKKKNPTKPAKHTSYPDYEFAPSVAKEPEAAYRLPEPPLAHVITPTKNPPSYTNILLSGTAAKPESHMTALEKMTLVRNGISKNDLETLKQKTALDYDSLAKALQVTRATLINKKRGEKFNTSVSERILSLADIYSYGYEVFESETNFKHWMNTANRALGGQCPIDLIDNQFGREEVKDIIGRIDYGVYS